MEETRQKILNNFAFKTANMQAKNMSKPVKVDKKTTIK